MELRLSEIKDIENIIKIINKGKEKLKNENIDQWQGEYPNKDVIMEDIEKGYSYVLELDGEIIGTAAVSLDGEETYNKIYEGKWISEEPYGVVHRFCVNLDLKLERKGSKLFNKIEELLVTNYSLLDSTYYLVTDGYISRIEPNTNIKDFIYYKYNKLFCQ